MQSSSAIFVFNQNPFRLSEEEYHSPEMVLKNYFELFGRAKPTTSSPLFKLKPLQTLAVPIAL
ncbi:hypothetical protein QFZ51_003865 [Chitinophaga sp. W3I9]